MYSNFILRSRIKSYKTMICIYIYVNVYMCIIYLLLYCAHFLVYTMVTTPKKKERKGTLVSKHSLLLGSDQTVQRYYHQWTGREMKKKQKTFSMCFSLSVLLTIRWLKFSSTWCIRESKYFPLWIPDIFKAPELSSSPMWGIVDRCLIFFEKVPKLRGSIRSTIVNIIRKSCIMPSVFNCAAITSD